MMTTLITFVLLMLSCCSLQLDFTAAQENINGECLTPTREAGTCIQLDKCEVLNNILTDPNLSQDDRDFLKLSQCGYANNTVSVCCPTKVVADRAGGRRYFTGWRRLETTQETIDYGPCITPNKERASCIVLDHCQYLNNLLLDPNLTRADTQYLVRSQCGYNNGKVLICCPQHQRFLQSNRPPITPPQRSSATTNRERGTLPVPPYCGIVLGDRIFGGTTAAIDEFPWLALIEYTKPGNEKGFHCGGSLINDRYVLTAAHCTKGSNFPPDWRLSAVRLGEYDIRTNPDFIVNLNGQKEYVPEHIDVGVENIIAHPEYDLESNNKQHDIALLRLARVINFTKFVKPICLPSSENLRGNTFSGLAMDVAGWGKTERSIASNLKMKATVNVWNLGECSSTYNLVNISLERTHMCAGGVGGVDSCSGDSGGPLMVEIKTPERNVFYVAGIVSFGPVQCGRQGWPGVYTRVGAYIEWIQNNVEP